MAVAGGSIMAKEQEELMISSSAMGLAEVRLFGSSERPICQQILIQKLLKRFSSLALGFAMP